MRVPATAGHHVPVLVSLMSGMLLHTILSHKHQKSLQSASSHTYSASINGHAHCRAHISVLQHQLAHSSSQICRQLRSLRVLHSSVLHTHATPVTQQRRTLFSWSAYSIPPPPPPLKLPSRYDVKPAVPWKEINDLSLPPRRSTRQSPLQTHAHVFTHTHALTTHLPFCSLLVHTGFSSSFVALCSVTVLATLLLIAVLLLGVLESNPTGKGW